MKGMDSILWEVRDWRLLTPGLWPPVPSWMSLSTVHTGSHARPPGAAECCRCTGDVTTSDRREADKSQMWKHGKE